MLNEAVLLALNTQMNNEFHNYQIYKSFSGICDYQSLLGATKYFQKQSEDEKLHFEKFYSYISDKGHIPQLTAQEEIPPQLLTLDMIFAQVVMLEESTLTNLQLVSQVTKEIGDDTSFGLLQWYLSEQTEECKTASDLYKRCLMSLNNILIFDNELGGL
jgi:ferritin